MPQFSVKPENVRIAAQRLAVNKACNKVGECKTQTKQNKNKKKEQTKSYGVIPYFKVKDNKKSKATRTTTTTTTTTKKE